MRQSKLLLQNSEMNIYIWMSCFYQLGSKEYRQQTKNEAKLQTKRKIEASAWLQIGQRPNSDVKPILNSKKPTVSDSQTYASAWAQLCQPDVYE